MGRDLITGETLTEFEAGMKVVFAVVDLVSLGSAMGVTKSLAFGTKEWLKTAGKIAVVELGSNAGAYTVGALSDSLGLPLPITLLLAGGSGTAIASSGAKNMFADSDSILRLLRGETDDVAVGRVALGDGVDGIEIRQMDLLDGVGNPIESGGDVLNSIDDIINDPSSLYGKSKADIEKILDDSWNAKPYGSSKTGWEFYRGDQRITYHPGGGRHGGSYYSYSSAATGRIKIVDQNYIPSPGEKSTIIQMN
jgi:hypothetical protein